MTKIDTKIKSFKILPQPTDESCGPTCLHAVYNYYDDETDINRLLKEVKQIKGGGTLAVMLANHALTRGYKATIYTYNLQMFDPTWFEGNTDISEKLTEQRQYKTSKRMQQATDAYLRFLSLGGQLKYEELNPELLENYLMDNIPILTGLSATYLYNSSREIPKYNVYHDTKGEPTGHFVVLSGLTNHEVEIADPLNPTPIYNKQQYYKVPTRRVIHAILLGILTFDANLLILQPK